MACKHMHLDPAKIERAQSHASCKGHDCRTGPFAVSSLIRVTQAIMSAGGLAYLELSDVKVGVQRVD